jgi:hypothetical protein
MEVSEFKRRFEELTNCEFSFDESAAPLRELEISRNIYISITDEEYDDIICQDATFVAALKNVIYVANYKKNEFYLIHYDIEYVEENIEENEEES